MKTIDMIAAMVRLAERKLARRQRKEATTVAPKPDKRAGVKAARKQRRKNRK